MRFGAGCRRKWRQKCPPDVTQSCRRRDRLNTISRDIGGPSRLGSRLSSLLELNPESTLPSPLETPTSGSSHQRISTAEMFAQRALRAPLQMSARAMRPTTLRAAAIAPFSTKPAPVQSQKQSAIKAKWFAAPPPPPAKYMVSEMSGEWNPSSDRDRQLFEVSRY